MAPLIFKATQPQFIANFPGSVDQLWKANLAARRAEEEDQLFESVLFVESGETVFIYGIELEDGLIKEIRDADVARQQQDFIQYLRNQTRLSNDSMGVMVAIFDGHEYKCEFRATAAYAAARNRVFNIGVGYRDKDGVFQRIAIEVEQED